MDSIELNPPSENFGLTNLTEDDYMRLQTELDAVTDAERRAWRTSRHITF
jgi:hypothetical protein